MLGLKPNLRASQGGSEEMDILTRVWRRWVFPEVDSRSKVTFTSNQRQGRSFKVEGQKLEVGGRRSEVKGECAVRCFKLLLQPRIKTMLIKKKCHAEFSYLNFSISEIVFFFISRFKIELCFGCIKYDKIKLLELMLLNFEAAM